MSRIRSCSKPGCANPAVTTMTFNHAEATAVLGPPITKANPIGCNPCQKHAKRLPIPRGWQVVRLADFSTLSVSNGEGLMALASTVRTTSRADSPHQ